MSDIPNVPPIHYDPEQIAKIKSELGIEGEVSSDDLVAAKSEAETPIKRRRGRPRKYHYDTSGKPTAIPLEEGEKEEPLGVLPSPPLSGRDSKEISKRLQGILIGATSLPAVGIHPAIQMTDKEAENIATPLTAYLMRTEATSQMARRVLNEYDLAAFVIATLAYMVRVIKEVRSEREPNAESSDRSSRRILERVPTSQRVVESTTEQAVPPSNADNENGQERPVSSEWASTATDLRRVTEV